LCVAALLAAATLSPAASAHNATAATAKSYKINYVTPPGPPPTDLSHITGKLKGTPFGPATFTGSVVVPLTKYVWKFSGGKLDVTFTAKVTGVDVAGPWVVTGGTGKFTSAKGNGTATGSINGSKPFHFVGKVTL
jgi:hypothetical protein